MSSSTTSSRPNVGTQIRRGFKFSVIVAPFALIAFLAKPIWEEYVKDWFHPTNTTVVERTLVLPLPLEKAALPSNDGGRSTEQAGTSTVTVSAKVTDASDKLVYFVWTVQEAVRITRPNSTSSPSHWTFPGSYIIVQNQGQFPEVNVVVDVSLRDTQRLNSVKCVPAQQVQINGESSATVTSKVMGEHSRTKHISILIASLPVKATAAIRISFEDDVLISEDPAVTVQSGIVAGSRTTLDQIPDFVQIVGRFN